MDINNILLNLEIIRQINEGDKLAIDILPGSIKLFVHSNTLFSGPKRWYNGYNREDNIKFIEELIVIIEKTSEIIIDGNHNELANNLKNAIKNSITGLNNLKITYINDSITIAKLTLIINRLNKVISNLENIDVIIQDNISMSLLNNIETNVNVNNNMDN
tara:strand:- start:42 stop:521 length:480 start_codon:yes stop_codon:yes gene_type:complete